MGCGPSSVLELRHRRQLEEGLGLVEVVPRPDRSVALDGRVWAYAGPRGDPFCTAIGDIGALTRGAVVGPAVERAADALAFDLATYGEVRPEVGAVGVDQTRLAGVRSVEHEV